MDPEDSLVDATHHDVAHAATIGTGPVDLARGTAGTGSGADEYTMPRAEASTALTAGELVGEYRIERKIGEGGMGVVYGAVHPLIGKRAAIKVLNKALCMQPEAVERFVTEARAANQIGHPNIVDVFAFGNLSDGRSYFVMEWLDGKSLAERLRKGLPPLAETIAILDEVAEALEAAHAKRIVHRDLKPDNVFLASAPGGKMKVKLLDFGIAKLLDDSAHRVTRTRTGSLMGTPLYVAPEQARGYEIDARVDVYSLGAMAFELLAGRPPFVADNAMDIVAMHLHQEPPSLATFAPGAPPVLIELVGRMLAKDPDARPGLAELRTALHRLADDAAAAALVPAAVVTPVAPAAVVPPVAPRSALWMAIVGAVVISAGAIGAFVLVRGGGSETPAAAPGSAAAAPVDDGAGMASGVVPPPGDDGADPLAGEVPAAADAAVPEVAPAALVLHLPAGAIGAVNVDAVEYDVPDDGELRVPVGAGSHTALITLDGYKPTQLQVLLEGGKDLELTPELKKARRSSSRKTSRGDKVVGSGKGSGTAGTGKGTGTAAGTGKGTGTAAGTGSGTRSPVDDDAVVNPFRRPK